MILIALAGAPVRVIRALIVRQEQILTALLYAMTAGEIRQSVFLAPVVSTAKGLMQQGRCTPVNQGYQRPCDTNLFNANPIAYRVVQHRATHQTRRGFRLCVCADKLHPRYFLRTSDRFSSRNEPYLYSGYWIKD